MPPRRRSNRKPKRMRGIRKNVYRKKHTAPIHYFKRSYYVPNAISSTAGAGDGLYGLAFTLGGLPNASEFTTLFDQYKIQGIKVRFMPRGNVSEINNATANAITSLATVIDYDDAATPTGVAQLAQYTNFKLTRSDRQLTRYFKPRINVGAINSVAGGVQNKMNTTAWLDCSVDTTEHYGMKVVIAEPPVSTTVFDMLVTMYLAFKNVR